MTTSSSRRVIKRLDASESGVVELYIPPQELTMSMKQKAPSFPRYSKEGKATGEYQLISGDSDLEVRQVYRESFEQDDQEEHVSDPGDEYIAKKKEEAEKILEEAREKARRILEETAVQAKQEREQVLQSGLQEGYENGYREGREKAEAECREELQNALDCFRRDIHQALKSVETAKEKCLHNYLEELKDCAVAVGEKVIHISLRSSGEVIKQMIISATEKLKKTAWVKIYIDKPDYDMMMEADADILDELSRLSDNIKFVVMDKEEQGNCIIEMPEEIVDVSVNTQIENIKDILENVRV